VPPWSKANLNARAPFVYELPLIRWLEREGFELAYQTNVDTHRDPASLAIRRLVVSAGHDEYWTLEMRGAFDDAVRRGVNLAFLGANTCYWQMAYEDAERTMVVYRSSERDPEPDRSRMTIRFRDLHPPRPERELIGQQYEGGLSSPSAVRAFRFCASFASDPWAAGVELDPERPVQRTVGYEWDTFDERHRPPRVSRILHHSDAELPSADCIRWTADSGARVLSAGSLQFVWSLDDWACPGTADTRIQDVVRAGFTEMSA
jgi:hypothetical protein